MRPKVWIWVIVIKNNRILLWKRKNAHWEWTWSFPWWHLEYWEEWAECAIRETMEETWLKIKNIEFFAVTNDVFKLERKHYITIFIKSDFDSWILEIKEPDKCEKWEWFEFDKLPENLFLPIENVIKEWYFDKLV